MHSQTFSFAQQTSLAAGTFKPIMV